jgi:tol-pal system protein YbgF
MPHRARYALLLALAAPSVGCASRASVASKQLDLLRADVARLRSEQDLLRARLEALEITSPASAHPTSAQVLRPRTDMQVIVLRPDGDAPEVLPSTEDEPVDALDVPAREAVRSRGKRSGRAGKEAALENASREYASALELAKRKDYDRAINALTGFIVHYPDDPNAGDALYWIGECYFAQADLTRAGENFEGVVARFPQGPRAADATLKLAHVYKARGDTDRAREALARLKSTYPKSDAARHAPTE